jgi:4-amino-4-deoxy-L-arabinose transferase-like glycosyltransferase
VHDVIMMKNFASTHATGRYSVLVILLVAWALRLMAFATVPGGIQHDEVLETLHAHELLAGHYQLYFYVGDDGHEPLLAYGQAFSLWALGQNLWGMRFWPVAAGLLTLPLMYVIGRRLLGREVGLLAAGVAATAFWPLVLSRVALRGTLMPPLTALAIYLFWRVYRPSSLRSPSPFLRSPLGEGSFLPPLSQGERGLGGEGLLRSAFVVGAALAMALGIYAYLSGWFVSAIAGAFLFYAFVTGRERLRWTTWLLYCGTLGLTAAPLVYIVTVSRRAEALTRVGQLDTLLRETLAGKLWPLLENSLSVLGSFSLRGDPFALYNIPHRPMLPPVLSLFFYVGLLLTIWRWRRPAYQLLGVWLVVGLLPTALAVGGPNHLRSGLILPVVYLLVAVGAAELVKIGPWRTGTWLLVATLLGGTAWGEVVDFGRKWSVHPETRYFFRSSLAEVARQMPSTDGRNCVSTPYPHDLSQWVAAYSRSSAEGNKNADEDICWFYGLGAMVFPAGPGPTRWYFPAAIGLDNDLVTKENAALNPALGRLLQEMTLIREEQTGLFPQDGAPAYHLYQAANPDDLRHQILAALPPDGLRWSRGGVAEAQPLAGPAHFAGGLILHGARVAVNPQTVDLFLLWQVDAAYDDTASVAIFAQLLNEQNEYITGNDRLDYAVSSWRAGDLFIQYLRLEQPPPGRYYPQVGVYDWRGQRRWALLQMGREVDNRVVLSPIELPPR